jgi:chaperonin cofactor prefoldin
MAALEKTFPCLTCGNEIKLERKDNRWLRWNLDGSVHVDAKKPFTQSKTAERIEALEKKVDLLIVQIQALRSDFKELKEKNRK